MGLDMYLTAERYLWSITPEDEAKANAIAKLFPELELDDKLDQRVKTVNVQIGYWRKANQIHSWFVRNIQEGKDDCERYYVSADKLQILLVTVDTILDSKDREATAKELLEPVGGFFFGSTDIDEYYFQDLEKTKKMLENILSNSALLNDWDIYYQSSW
jgi:hypothetical protein